MKSYLLAFTVSAFTCALLTPLARMLAFRLGAVSVPGGRHIHHRTIPRLGGIAIFFGFFAPLAMLFFIQSSVAQVFRAQSERAIGLLVGGTALCVLGIWDDTRRVRALYKLYVQIGAAVVAIACGLKIEAVALPIVGALSMGVFSLPVTILWIVGIVNAINLIDGLDGLAGGVVFFAAFTGLVVALLSGNVMVALLMTAVLGSVIGFLFYNFNPARIFMGDSGSYFLGYLLATTSLLGSMQRASTAVSLLVPILAMGVPIFDTLFAMVRRFLERRPIFSPDRGHVHHRLLDMGITHRRAVLILYALSIVFTAAAIGVSLGKSWQIGAALVVLSVVLVGFVRFAGYFEYLHRVRRQKSRLRSADAERLRRMVPQVAAVLSGAATEDDVWAALRQMMETAQLDVVEVLVPAEGKTPALSWNRAGADTSPNERVSARYPVGHEGVARSSIKFHWTTDDGTVSPQSEVLLQLVVDVVCTALRRTGSEYAPAVVSTTARDERTSIPTPVIELPSS